MLMIIDTLKHSINKSVTITFKSKELLAMSYVYINVLNVKKFFQITESFVEESSEYITYTAVDCGYGKDKLSDRPRLDGRVFLGEPIFEIDPDEIKDLIKRSRYN